MGKSTPQQPDYEAAAIASGESAAEAIRDQTWANRIEQTNPWGSLTYDTESVIDPATGEPVTKWSQTQTLDPEAQAALDAQLGIDRAKSEFAGRLMGRAGNRLLQDTDYNKFQSMATAPQVTQRNVGVPRYSGGNNGMKAPSEAQLQAQLLRGRQDG